MWLRTRGEGGAVVPCSRCCVPALFRESPPLFPAQALRTQQGPRPRFLRRPTRAHGRGDRQQPGATRGRERCAQPATAAAPSFRSAARGRSLYDMNFPIRSRMEVRTRPGRTPGFFLLATECPHLPRSCANSTPPFLPRRPMLRRRGTCTGGSRTGARRSGAA